MIFIKRVKLAGPFSTRQGLERGHDYRIYVDQVPKPRQNLWVRILLEEITGHYGWDDFLIGFSTVEMLHNPRYFCGNSTQ
jgi:hypothetical protein